MSSSSAKTVDRWALRAEPWLVGLLMTYFALRLILLATSLAPGVPPDETTHLGIIGLYEHAFPTVTIADSPESSPYGVVGHSPNLYYVLTAWLAKLNVFGMDRLLFLRLVNVLLALLTVLTAYRLSLRLSCDPMIRVAAIGVLTNILGFGFVSAGVNYDNLVNLLAALSISAFAAFATKAEPRQLVLLTLWAALGSLTKVSFLPLAAVLAVLLVAVRNRELWPDLVRVAEAFKTRRPGFVTATVAAVTAGALAIGLYSSNEIRFGRLIPECQQVSPFELCMENRIFARNWVVRQYMDDEMTYRQAVEATNLISHPGDRAHAIRILDNERAFKAASPELLPAWDYVQVVWARAMKPTIFGAQGHASLTRSPRSLVVLNLVLFAAFVAWVRRVSWAPEERVWTLLAVVVFGYYLILVGYYNYRNYLTSHALFLGVQGRYLFPVLVPAVLVACRSLLAPLRAWAKPLGGVALVAIFVVNDFVYFVRHATADFFSPESPLMGLLS